MPLRRFRSGFVPLVLLAACAAPPGTSPESVPATVAPPAASEQATSSATAVSDAVVASIALEGSGGSIAVGEGAVWIRLFDGSVTRVDPDSNTVAATIAVGTGEFGNVAVGEGAVWVTTFAEDKVSRIDPVSNEVVAEITVGRNPEGITVAAGSVWVSNHRGGSISRIDPANNTVAVTIALGPEGPSGPKNIALAAGDLWTPVPNMSAVVRIDPETNQVLETFPFASLDGLISDGETVHVFAAGHVSEIDPGSSSVVGELDPGAVPVAFGLASFWAVTGPDLLQLDPDTLEPKETWRVFDSPPAFVAIGIDAGSIWLLPIDQPLLVRMEPAA